MFVWTLFIKTFEFIIIFIFTFIVFLWRVMIAALIFLALIAFTNYLMIFLSCYGLKNYGAWLNKNHKVDLWCIRILVRCHCFSFIISNLKCVGRIFGGIIPKIFCLHKWKALHLCCRFRMALQHTRHGQLLPPCSTSLLC